MCKMASIVKDEKSLVDFILSAEMFFLVNAFVSFAINTQFDQMETALECGIWI